MEQTVVTKEFLFGGKLVRLQLPDEAKVKEQHAALKKLHPDAPFPYWARLWPSAVAMSHFLVQHVDIIKGKSVLELAAGLGLPSLVAATFAKTVLCTDYNKDAVQLVWQSAAINGLQNVNASVLDWNNLPADLEADVLLLSDVAYDPAAFETLLALIHHFLQKDTTIILSTPQRLLSKPFAERLLPFCTQVATEDVADTSISIFVLKALNK